MLRVCGVWMAFVFFGRCLLIVHRSIFLLPQGGLSAYEFNTEDFPDPYPEEVVSRELLSREGKENGEPWAKGTLWAPLESEEFVAVTSKKGRK